MPAYPLTKSILCTIGPASWDEAILKRLESLGVSLFRINLSHTRIEDLPQVIERLQRASKVPICLDSEGAQIRTRSFADGKVFLMENSIVDVPHAVVPGDAKCFNLHPLDISRGFHVGDLLTIDFHAVLVQVVAVHSKGVKLRVLTGGWVGQNKAVSLQREIPMPPLTPKDLEAMSIGRRYGIKHVALSFANSAEDVQAMRKVAGQDVKIIAKIESLAGIRNLEAIASQANALLIDRGDLSRQVPIEQIPMVQKDIIRRAKAINSTIFVATNLLESMIVAPGPTRAEVNDIFNTLCDGADGLVLAAETAIGAHPLQAATMVAKVIAEYDSFQAGTSVEQALKQRESLLLVSPHGGHLVEALDFDTDEKKLKGLKELIVERTVLMDAQQIATGVFSPLDGFMNKAQLQGVLSHYRLPSGDIWPLPILFPIDAKDKERLSVGETIVLRDRYDKQAYATLTITEIFQYDLKKLCQDMFGTTEEAHPGVKQTMGLSGSYVSGKVRLLKRLPSKLDVYELTPRQTRAIFEYKGWSRIVAFHTRNVVHRAHEYIQLRAFNQHHCDGIFIHPVIGPKKSGDYADEIILSTYELAVERFYPKSKVLLGAFAAYARYCGPREAVFTALCRKNYGCSHFIVGRDHTGVGQFYTPQQSQELFKQLGDLGIEPVFFDQVHYCQECQDHVSVCAHGMNAANQISGTQSRDAIRAGQSLPDWFMRTEVANVILEQQRQGKDIFVP